MLKKALSQFERVKEMAKIEIYGAAAVVVCFLISALLCGILYLVMENAECKEKIRTLKAENRKLKKEMWD